MPPQELAKRGHQTNLWPAEANGFEARRFREIAEAHAAHIHRLSHKLIQISAVALGLREDFFSGAYAAMKHRLRLANYPDQTEVPPRGLTGSTRRISLAMFTGPSDDAFLSCVPICAGPGNPAKYPPIRAADHMAQLLKAMHPV